MTYDYMPIHWRSPGFSPRVALLRFSPLRSVPQSAGASCLCSILTMDSAPQSAVASSTLYLQSRVIKPVDLLRRTPSLVKPLIGSPGYLS